MAALNLTFGQLGIGTTAYGDLREFSPPAITRQRMQHVTSNSTVFPTKELGYLPMTVAGVMSITAASVDEFVIAVATGSAERKISWMLGATEVYGYAYSGDSGPALECVNPYGSQTRIYLVPFSFTLSRSKVYKASDDSVLWGG